MDLKENQNFNSENENNHSEFLIIHDKNEELREKIVDIFSIRLMLLEQSYQEKETDVNHMMFKLHSVIKIGNDIKTNFLAVKINRNSNQIDQEDLLNCSKMSTISKRSFSSNKASLGKHFNKNIKPQEKLSKFSQKVSINICSSHSQDTNINRSILNKRAKNDSPNTPPKVPSQNKFNINSKVKILKPESSNTNNKVIIKKSDDLLIKVNIRKSPIINTNTNLGKIIKETFTVDKSKQLKRKTNSYDLNAGNNVKVKTLNQANNSSQLTNISNPQINKYHSSDNNSAELFVNRINNNPATYILEPKKLKDNLIINQKTNQKITHLLFDHGQ